MKRIGILVLSLSLVISVAACGNKAVNEINKKKEVKALQNNTQENEEKVENNEKEAFVENYDSHQAKKLIEKEEELLILDVRTKEEFNRGHLKGATLIPYDELEDRIDEIKDYKDKKILVYCRTGRRSGIAVEVLEKAGFKSIYHMNQGISEWEYDVEASQ